MWDAQVAVILGIVEGLTEFIPVSSTGHLIVAAELLNFTGPKAFCFEVFIQLGAILAVVVLYRRRFLALIPRREVSADRGDGFSGVRGLVLLGLTTLPALVAGFLAHGYIKTYLFSATTVAFALAAGGVGILLAERFKPIPHVTDVNGLGYAQAFLIGCFQCLALWPGVSRSASTIIGGLFNGLDRRTSAEYSFLAAVPVMIAATVYDVFKARHFLDFDDVAMFATGFVVSFVSAAIAVKTFIALVQRWSLAPFAWYRIAVAPLIFFLT